jgi:hypothetical protein
LRIPGPKLSAAAGRIVGCMTVVLVVGLWVGLDCALLILWLAIVASRERSQIRGMVEAAERYANTPAGAWPRGASLDSWHAEDAEIRHAR